MSEAFAAIALLIFVVALIICGPFITIWSLNTLFGLAIAMTFKTWFATLWIGAIVGSGAAASSKKS